MTRPFDIIVPAAGTGTRMQASLRRGQDNSAQLPKQYLELAGVAILERTLLRLLELKPRRLCLVVAAEDNYWQQLPSSVHREVTLGGETRAESVQAGLAALDADEQELVLVHDSVRPLFDLEVVRQLLDRAETSPNGALGAERLVRTIWH